MAKKTATRKIKKNELGVLLEHLDSKFEQVLEGHAALDTKFEKKIDDFRHEVRNDVSFLKLGQQVLKNKVDDLIQSSQQIFEYLKRIDDEIQELKALLSKKANLQRLERLEQEVAHIKLVIQKWQK